MVTIALGVTAPQSNYTTQANPPASEAVRADGGRRNEVAAAATLVIERAPRLSFIYTKIDPSTGEEFWRWPTRPSAARTSPEPVSAIGQLVDVTA